MIYDFILMTLLMLALGTFSFGGIIVCSLISEKHRVVKSEAFEVSKDAGENR